MIRAIVFDCFGVLVGKGFGDVYKTGGGDPIKDREFIDSMIDKSNRGRITSDQFGAVIADRLGISMVEYRDLIAREEAPNLELLSYIRNELRPKYKLAVLSNVSAGGVGRRISAEDYALFDIVIESASTKWAKPDREIFQLAADKLGVAFNEMIFIDDLEIFTTPAASYGMHAVRYTGLDALKAQLTTLLAD